MTSGDGGSIILVGGHGNDTTQSLDTVLQYQGSGGGWTTLPSEMITPDASNPSLLCILGLLTARRDHACMWVEFETSAGVLVTGGLGPGDEVLSSAEFYDVNTKEWHQVSWFAIIVTLL